MTWDATKPAGNQKLRLADDDLRENNDCLEDALSRDHEFPGTKGSTAGKHNVIQLIDQAGDEAADVSDVKLWNNGGDLKAILPGGSALSIFGTLDAPAGTEMIFIQNSAPTGWTRNAARQDGAMMVYAAAGDVAAGGAVDAKAAHTHTGPSHTHTGPSHTHTGPSHTHTGPSHTHTIAHTHNLARTGSANMHFAGTAMGSDAVGGQLGLYSSGGSVQPVADLTTAASSANSGAEGTGATGAGGTGATGAGGTGATGAEGTGATGANTAPFYQEIISCTKD